MAPMSPDAWLYLALGHWGSGTRGSSAVESAVRAVLYYKLQACSAFAQALAMYMPTLFAQLWRVGGRKPS